MEAFTDMFASEMRSKRFHENYTCAMTWCFQPETLLHKRNFQMSDDDLKRLATSRQLWRKDLKQGDSVDVNIWSDDKQKVKGWVQGRVERVEGDLLSIVFPHLPVEYDMDMERWSIDLAVFETHTKEDVAWRNTFASTATKDFICDMHDKFKWEEGTIFDVSEDRSGGRSVLMANCGFRVYRNVGKKLRTDEQGRVFDGWSSKYDEFIPLYNPRIQPHMSKVAATVYDEDEVDEELDNMVSPEPGHDRVYCVPRLGSCISSKFIHLMNRFGSQGGFNLLLSTLAELKPDDELTLTTMSYMITMISMPSKLFHKDWMAEHGSHFTAAIEKQLLAASDKILKDVSAHNVNQIQISINSINLRLMDKEESRTAAEKLKLEICKKCLSSDLLERRILGIKELNTIIRNTQMNYTATKIFTMEQLIGWMSEQGVFGILWDPKKTHLQLVQRSNEIFKILPRENLLSMELLVQFWSLAKSDYKSEVFKIISDAAFHLDQEHIEYLFEQITETPAAKLGMEEFEAIAQLGRFSKSFEFSRKTSEFFWRIITNSDEHKADLIENCINKFSDMIKYQQMEKKQPYFDNLVE